MHQPDWRGQERNSEFRLNDQTGRSPKQTSNMGQCSRRTFRSLQGAILRFSCGLDGWQTMCSMDSRTARSSQDSTCVTSIGRLWQNKMVRDISTPQIWELPGSSKELVVVWSIHTL